jgi:hypothetical protein
MDALKGLFGTSPNAEKNQIAEVNIPPAVESGNAPLLDAIKAAKEMAVEKKLTDIATKLQEAIDAVPTTPEPEPPILRGGRRRRTHRSKSRRRRTQRSRRR